MYTSVECPRTRHSPWSSLWMRSGKPDGERHVLAVRELGGEGLALVRRRLGGEAAVVARAADPSHGERDGAGSSLVEERGEARGRDEELVHVHEQRPRRVGRPRLRVAIDTGQHLVVIPRGGVRVRAQRGEDERRVGSDLLPRPARKRDVRVGVEVQPPRAEGSVVPDPGAQPRTRVRDPMRAHLQRHRLSRGDERRHADGARPGSDDNRARRDGASESARERGREPRLRHVARSRGLRRPTAVLLAAVASLALDDAALPRRVSAAAPRRRQRREGDGTGRREQGGGRRTGTPASTGTQGPSTTSPEPAVSERGGARTGPRQRAKRSRRSTPDASGGRRPALELLDGLDRSVCVCPRRRGAVVAPRRTKLTLLFRASLSTRHPPLPPLSRPPHSRQPSCMSLDEASVEATVARLCPGVSVQPHQLLVAKRILSHDAVLVFMGVGTGKTLAAIAAAELLMARDEGIDGAVVITKTALRDVFVRELGKSGARGTEGRYAIHAITDPQSIDGVDCARKVLIVDEVHNARSRDSKNSRYDTLMRACRSAPKRILMTATPFINDFEEVCPIVNLALAKDEFPKGGQAAAWRALSAWRAAATTRARGESTRAWRCTEPRPSG